MEKPSLKHILSHNIKKYHADKTQQWLAENVGISVHSVAKLEGAKTFASSETIDKLCEVLDIEPYQLFEPEPSGNYRDEETRRYIKNTTALAKGKKLQLMRRLIEAADRD